MKCKKCGFEMADNAKFCPQCGAKADEEAMSSVNTQNNDENEKNDAEEVVTENDKEQEGISNEKGSKFSDNKKKILIIASIAVVIIIIAVISSKSGSSDNSYTGNADTDSGYNDIDENYDDDFGNDDVVTEPETTESITFDYKVEYDKELEDYTEQIVKVDGYQFTPNIVLGDCFGVNLIVDFSTISVGDSSGKYFSYRIEGYDNDDNLIYSDDLIASFKDGKSREEVPISFDDLNGDLYKIVILGDWFLIWKANLNIRKF